MALTSTMFRFVIDVSDVERGVYESFDERVAMHPSESNAYMLTRVLAFALELRPGLAFGRGIAFPDEAAISAPNDRGGVAVWIEVGVPSAAKLHRVAKQADEVRVYSHRGAEFVARELSGATIHRAESIEILGFAGSFLDALVARLDRRNLWSVTRNDGMLYVTVGDETFESSVERARLGA